MDTLTYNIIRNLVDRYDMTEPEAGGMARYLLWLQMGGEYCHARKATALVS